MLADPTETVVPCEQLLQCADVVEVIMGKNVLRRAVADVVGGCCVGNMLCCSH
jgi:hypothetical protein